MTHRKLVLVATLALAHAACYQTGASNDSLDAEASAPQDAATSVEQPAAEPPASPAIEHAYVVDANGPSIVLEANAQDTWATGSPEITADSNGIVVRRHVDPSAAPPERMAWAGRTVRVFHDANAVCTARIGSPYVAGLFARDARIAHRDDEGNDDGESDSAEAALAAPTPALATRAWEESGDGGSRVLLAPLVALEGDCSTGLWATSIEYSPHALVAAVDADDVLRERARDALRATDDYREAEQSYIAEDDRRRHQLWDEDASAEFTVRTVSRSDGTTFVWGWMAAGEGCGGWGASVSRVWRLERGVLAPVRRDENLPTVAPSAVIDVTGDGSFEWIRAYDNARLDGDEPIDPLPSRIEGNTCGC